MDFTITTKRKNIPKYTILITNPYVFLLLQKRNDKRL